MFRLVQGGWPICKKKKWVGIFSQKMCHFTRSPVTVAPQLQTLFPEVYCAFLVPEKKTKKLVS